MHYDVLIIGAGMSGLAAGIRCAHYGKKVAILEKHYLWGGLNSFYRLKGYRFDVGLHAMTNYAPRGTRGAPLTKLLRQLRIDHDALDLSPQIESEIAFPGVRLRFNNDFGLFETEVREKFPAQADGFQALVRHIRAFNELDLNLPYQSARAVIAQFVNDPMLADMILCPLMFYGSAVEDDMDFAQFVIMFKSIFMEGFARPRRGVRQVLDLLVKRYKDLGGELRMKTAVTSLNVENDRVKSLTLASGEELTAECILSSAGFVETMRLCSDQPADAFAENIGGLTFTESIAVLDVPPRDLGYGKTITFYNNSDRFRYRSPDDYIDPTSAVVCCPNNYRYDSPLEQNMIRLTHLANWPRWAKLQGDDYTATKEQCLKRSHEAAVRFIPDFRAHITFIDHFTPKTIYKFTGHLGGAVYGSPHKLRTGQTRLKNLVLCGTDQGFLGIVGAMLSGISMANRHVLMADV